MKSMMMGIDKLAQISETDNRHLGRFGDVERSAVPGSTQAKFFSHIEILSVADS